MGMRSMAGKIVQSATRKVVEDDDIVVSLKQPVDKMAADEAGPTRHHNLPSAHWHAASISEGPATFCYWPVEFMLSRTRVIDSAGSVVVAEPLLKFTGLSIAWIPSGRALLKRYTRPEPDAAASLSDSVTGMSASVR